ncbi:carbohydrate-binding domain-containing protein [Ruminococcaceae bacterium OttesenSCG-928-L11]|nr:carbohydrate-binding domain-containing protein [Ruminococcaceae bacterium OttesenSCG-928-L11]
MDWTDDDGYNSEVSGDYGFTAVLGEGYALADGVVAPVFTVTVGMGIQRNALYSTQRTSTLIIDSTTVTQDNIATEGWKWDQDTSTLTLNGLDIAATGSNNGIQTAIDITIVLEGADNKIETEAIYGIYADGSLIIKGDGALTVNAGGDGIYMASGALTIESGTLNLNGDLAGSNGRGIISTNTATDIIINGGNVTVTGGYGIYTTHSIVVNDGSLTVTGAANAGITCKSLTIKGGLVEATSTSSLHMPYAVFVETKEDGIVINDGTLIARSTNGALFLNQPVLSLTYQYRLSDTAAYTDQTIPYVWNYTDRYVEIIAEGLYNSDVSGITANPTGLTAAGGTVALTLTGTNLDSHAVKVGRFIGTNCQQSWDVADNAASVTIPENQSAIRDIAHTFRVSLDNGATWLTAPTATVTQTKASGTAKQRTSTLLIDSTTVTQDNIAAEGWKWDQDTSTLTLNGLDIAMTGIYDHGIQTAIDITIVLEGADNKIETEATTGIRAEGSLIIKGDGALTVNAGRSGIYMASGALTIESGTLNLNGNAALSNGHGIHSASTETGITINDGNVTVTGRCGVSNSVSTLTVNGGSLTATGAADAGIWCESLTIEGGTVEVVSTGTDSFSYGVNARYGSGNITINDGTLIARSTNAMALYGRMVLPSGYKYRLSDTASYTYSNIPYVSNTTDRYVEIIIEDLPDPVVSDITADPTSLTAAGGTVSLTLTGTYLDLHAVKVGRFIGTDCQQSWSVTNNSASATIPANQDTTSDIVHTFRVSVDNGATWLIAPTATVTQAKASETPTQRTSTLHIESTTATQDNIATEGWKWDQNTSTLTLNGLDIATTGSNRGIQTAINITIVLEGSDNKIETEEAHGIYANGSLIIQGDGALTVNAGRSGIYMASGALAIESGTLNLNGNPTNSNQSGIFTGSASPGITINGGVVTATGDKGIEVYGDNSSFTINGGVVTATGNKGIEFYSANSSFTINGGTVKATGTTESGIQCGSLTVQGGIVEAIFTGTDKFSYGVKTGGGNITINDGTLIVRSTNAEVFNKQPTLPTRYKYRLSDTAAYTYQSTPYVKNTIDRYVEIIAEDLSSACEILSVNSPVGASLNDTAINATVNSFSVTVDVAVSEGATWKLYRAPGCTDEIIGAWALTPGNNNIAYIRVTAENGADKKDYRFAVTYTNNDDNSNNNPDDNNENSNNNPDDNNENSNNNPNDNDDNSNNSSNNNSNNNNSGNKSGGSGSGGSGGGGGGAAPTRPILTVNETKAKAALADMQKTGRKKARITGNGQIKMTPSAWQALGSTLVDFDTLAKGAVQLRITVKNPGKMTSEMHLSGELTGSAVNARKAFFEKWFKNKVQVIRLDQSDSFGQPVEIVAKVDLTGMSTKQLVFYVYDRATNTYKRIENAAYWIDQNGYLHFTTEVAGDIIISDGPLERK